MSTQSAWPHLPRIAAQKRWTRVDAYVEGFETRLRIDKWERTERVVVYQNYPQAYVLNNVDQDMVIDFIGMKMGDINNTVGMSGGQDLVNAGV